jgi:hypothetical protein
MCDGTVAALRGRRRAASRKSARSLLRGIRSSIARGTVIAQVTVSTALANSTSMLSPAAVEVSARRFDLPQGRDFGKGV